MTYQIKMIRVRVLFLMLLTKSVGAIDSKYLFLSFNRLWVLRVYLIVLLLGIHALCVFG